MRASSKRPDTASHSRLGIGKSVAKIYQLIIGWNPAGWGVQYKSKRGATDSLRGIVVRTTVAEDSVWMGGTRIVTIIRLV